MVIRRHRRAGKPKLTGLLMLGDGERLISGVGPLELRQVRSIEAPGVTHVRFEVVR